MQVCPKFRECEQIWGERANINIVHKHSTSQIGKKSQLRNEENDDSLNLDNNAPWNDDDNNDNFDNDSNPNIAEGTENNINAGLPDSQLSSQSGV